MVEFSIFRSALALLLAEGGELIELVAGEYRSSDDDTAAHQSPMESTERKRARDLWTRSQIPQCKGHYTALCKLCSIKFLGNPHNAHLLTIRCPSFYK